LKPPEEMVRLFESLPEAISNTLRIADRCAGFNITQDLGYQFPDFQRDRSESADEALSRICWEALAHRYNRDTDWVRVQARQRLRTELELVRHHGLGGFFLVYRELLELAKEIAARIRGREARGRFNYPPGRGRGSSVSSIICYLIGLSPVDPVKAKLSLGRFLNKELASIPDIDLDFPRDIREELIKAVHERYGHDHVAMVATFPTYRLRSAVRDVGKALGLPPGEVDRLARLSEGRSATTVEEEMRRLPGFQGALESPLWQHLIERARELSGFPRHLSQHPGGMIISSRPLVEMVPVEHSRMDGRLLCQWDKDSCDDARFIKIDFLSLGMLSAVEECLNLIETNGKKPVDLGRINFDDAAIYDRICAGDTVGVFQIESRAQIQMLPRTQPRNIEELAIEIAIVRPGPIVGGAVNPYIRRREQLRRNPRAQIYYEHALLIPVLSETLGVIIYQDQVLSVCQALAGFSIGRAEALRRTMSRRRSLEAMAQFEKEFLDGAKERGVHRRSALRIFKQILGFAEYGFPKSHAAAFAILSYQSTWLCHYHPAEFVASVLNNQPMGFYPRDVLLKDAQRHGVLFERPDINRS
ncbi:MAG: DNA polymerase III subunit alpha, partial [Armatimonadota bacterium]|nr:DNA polymerase III subunit alpha [Armatimonadota bacterium]